MVHPTIIKQLTDHGISFIAAFRLYDPVSWHLLEIELDKLKRRGTRCIIDYSSENYNDEVLVAYDKFVDYGLDFVILSHDPSHHLVKPNIVFWPYWLHWSQERLTFPGFNTSNIRKYPIASMARYPRTHRILNYLRLKEKHYFDSNVITIHQVNDVAPISRPDDVVLPQNDQLIWQLIQGTLPKIPKLSFSVIHPGYTDSYINLIVETTANTGFFISEKTWQPIASGQLFLIWGSKGSIEHLRTMGVDVFDDIIDHKYYDSEEDPYKRLDKIHQVLDQLVTLDLANVYDRTLERRLSNSAKFHNNEFNQIYLNDLTNVSTR